MRVTNDETDPVGTEIVEVSCPECTNEGDRPEIHYYDAKGRWFNGERFMTVGALDRPRSRSSKPEMGGETRPRKGAEAAGLAKAGEVEPEPSAEVTARHLKRRLARRGS